MGPASTKHITSGTVGSGQKLKIGNMFMDDKDHHDGGDITSRVCFEEQSHDGAYDPTKVVSVAERSVLSQNFVNGTEETEESIIGVAKKTVQKPLAYGEFKDAVRRQADMSTAPTHDEFMWEVSESKLINFDLFVVTKCFLNLNKQPGNQCVMLISNQLD